MECFWHMVLIETVKGACVCVCVLFFEEKQGWVLTAQPEGR